MIPLAPQPKTASMMAMGSTDVEPLPESFPPPATGERGSQDEGRRRAVFSQTYMALGRLHIVPHAGDAHTENVRRRRRIVQDDSLKLIDDLTSRSVDPLFEDSTLLAGRRLDKGTRFMYHALSFLLSVAIGIGGCLAVQQLQKQTRQKVRDEYARQLVSLRGQASALQDEVDSLNGQITDLTGADGTDSAEQNAIAMDGMANGTIAVSGPGVSVTLADPLSQTLSDQTGTPHDGSSNASAQVRIVRDTDLQFVVDVLWSAGAEAISVNGHRLGTQSAIRKAGQSILVGVNAVQSPYEVDAIGDEQALRSTLGNDWARRQFDGLKDVGISVDVSTKSKLTMDAASQPDLNYARKQED